MKAKQISKCIILVEKGFLVLLEDLLLAAAQHATCCCGSGSRDVAAKSCVVFSVF